MNMYMPSVTSSIADKEKNTVTQAIINEVLEDYPILKYFDENNGYETSADSEYTYEMIIAAEATDENYINQETGEAINSAGELVAEENAQYIERENNSSNTNSDSLDSSDETLVNETNTNENTEQQTAQQEEGNSAKAVNQGTVTAITGTEYSLEKLADFDFLKNTFYSVDSTTSVDSERINAKNMLERDMTIQKDTSVPQILIYHTHSQEAFVDSIEGDASTTIVGVGEYLAEILAGTYGYNVIHNSSTYDMVNGKIDRNYAFTLAEPDIKRILQENPSIQVVIDLHRDGINENTHLVTDVNGKPTAQFMFFNGLSYNTKVGNIEYLYNPYIEDNLAFSFQMQLQAMKLYPNVTRKIYLKGYRYNLHLMPRATLIEIGGQTNTVEEAKNAMEPLADIINKVLEGN
ncbi:stage II sporulation protein P [Lachnotalea glycerini]|nr:stage II sporulation protein P [Lachnotalea glycerini]